MLHLLYAPVTYLVLGLISLAGYIVYRAALPKPLPGIPYHQASAKRISGDLPSLVEHHKRVGTLHDWLALQADEFNSPIFQLFLKPFSKPDVYITDPRETQDILLRRAKEFDRSNILWDSFVGTVPNFHLIQPTNEKWRQSVKLIADTMGISFLHGVAVPILYKRCLDLMELWRVKSDAAPEHAFDAADDVLHYGFGTIWEVVFGTSMRALSSETTFLKATLPEFNNIPTSKDDPVDFPTPQRSTDVVSIKVVAHGLDVGVESSVPRLAHWRLRMTPTYRRARAHVDHIVQSRLDDAKSRLLDPTTGKSVGNDMGDITSAMDLMVRREAQAAEKEGRRPRYDSDMAKDEMLGFLLGGFDTTPTALKWSVKYLSNHPRVQSKLRGILHDAWDRPRQEEEGENAAATPTRIPTPEQIATARLPYLDAVVEELIRCGQTSSGSVRRALRDTQVLGHHIPKGVDVYMLSNGPGYMMPNDVNEGIPEAVRSASSRDHKDRAVPSWDRRDCGQFRPERWIKTDADGGETFDARAGPSMQLGMGLRACFGRKLAYLQIRFFVVMLVWTFELQLLPERLRGYEATDGLSHTPNHCYLRLKRTSEE